MPLPLPKRGTGWPKKVTKTIWGQKEVTWGPEEITYRLPSLTRAGKSENNTTTRNTWRIAVKLNRTTAILIGFAFGGDTDKIRGHLEQHGIDSIYVPSLIYHQTNKTTDLLQTFAISGRIWQTEQNNWTQSLEPKKQALNILETWVEAEENQERLTRGQSAVLARIKLIELNELTQSPQRINWDKLEQICRIGRHFAHFRPEPETIAHRL